MKTKSIKTIIGISACIAAAGLAYAAVTIDDDGVGFVGKGDVQDVFGWNNAQLQAAADDVQFRFNQSSVTTTGYSWTCDRDAGPQTQERARTVTTTTSSYGVLSSAARVKKQVTGFNLNGYDGDVETEETTESNGQPLWSCPTGWTAIDMVTETETEILGEGLEVSGDGGATWYPLPITPVEEL